MKKINEIEFQQHLGIKEQTWKDIPMLAVITGKNGAGKSQLFTAIKQGKIDSSIHYYIWYSDNDDIDSFNSNEVKIFTPITELPFDDETKEKLKQQLLKRETQNLVRQEDKKEIAFLEDNRIKKFNIFLEKYENYFPHKVGYDGNFYKDGAKIALEELSSGEQIIVRLFYHAFKIKDNMEKFVEYNYSPLLLLDEYDVHLHPSFIKVFMQIIEKVFVEDCGIQVMLITHNPTTLSCAPKESIFFMEDGEIQKMGKEKAIRKLTEKLYTENDLTNILKIIVKVDSTNLLVEGKYDKTILETYLTYLNEQKLITKFNIIALGGAQNITKVVNNIFAADDELKSTKFIALFDNDNNETKKAFDDLEIEKQNNIKKIPLPVIGTIEDMFNPEVLAKNNCLNNKKPCKEKIAKECAELLKNDEQAQQNFKTLFNNIKEMEKEMEKQNKQ